MSSPSCKIQSLAADKPNDGGRQAVAVPHEERVDQKECSASARIVVKRIQLASGAAASSQMTDEQCIQVLMEANFMAFVSDCPNVVKFYGSCVTPIPNREVSPALAHALSFSRSLSLCVCVYVCVCVCQCHAQSDYKKNKENKKPNFKFI